MSEAFRFLTERMKKCCFPNFSGCVYLGFGRLFRIIYIIDICIVRKIEF